MQIFNLLIKDVKNIIYDRKSLVVLIVMPVVIMSILGISLGGMFGSNIGTEYDPLKIAIVKEYDANREIENAKDFLKNSFQIESQNEEVESINFDKIFFEQFLDNGMENFMVYEIVDSSMKDNVFKEGKYDALVILEKNIVFHTYVNFFSPLRNETKIKIIVDQEKAFNGNIINMVMESFTEELNIRKAQSAVLMESLIASGNISEIEKLMEGFSDRLTKQIKVDIQEMTVDQKESVNSFQYYAAATMCMFLLYAASFGGKAILSEQKESTLARLNVQGIQIRSIIVSNFIRISMIVMAQSLVMIIFSSLVLGVQWGSMPTILLTIFCLSMTVGSIGMMLSVISLVYNSNMVANIFEFVVIQTMALLGGSFIPVEILPKAISKASFLSISGVGLKMYLNGMYDNPISDNIDEMSILAAYVVMSIVTTMIIIHINRKKVHV